VSEPAGVLTVVLNRCSSPVIDLFHPMIGKIRR